MAISKCKICRRAGVKLFLKGERCFTPKCSMIRRPYPPGQKSKRKTPSLSEFGKELKEKQKLKNLYHLRERQFKNYVKKILGKRGKVEDASDLLIKVLESRLDNVVFRLGFANSKIKARQLVSHSFFLVNGKPVNTPSFRLKKGNIVSVKPSKIKKAVFKDIKNIIKKNKPLTWLEINADKLEGKIIGEPSLAETAPPVEIASIFEFYSR
jgi:small subunit ribosomal protein S4